MLYTDNTNCWSLTTDRLLLKTKQKNPTKQAEKWKSLHPQTLESILASPAWVILSIYFILTFI